MSSRGRIGLLGLSVVVLVVAFIALRPADDTDPADTTSATATATVTPSPVVTEDGTPDDAATPSPTPSPEPTVDPGPLLTTAKVTKIRVKKGDTVRFRARASQDEEIHVHGYDLSQAVTPGKTARMTFKADIEGIFEIEYEHSGTPIAELRVDPR